MFKKLFLISLIFSNLIIFNSQSTTLDWFSNNRNKTAFLLGFANTAIYNFTKYIKCSHATQNFVSYPITAFEILNTIYPSNYWSSWIFTRIPFSLTGRIIGHLPSLGYEIPKQNWIKEALGW